MTTKKAAENTAVGSGTKYRIDKLRAACFDKLGVTQSEFDAAFAGRTGTFTLAEAKAVISEWEDTPVPIRSEVR